MTLILLGRAVTLFWHRTNVAHRQTSQQAKHPIQMKQKHILKTTAAKSPAEIVLFPNRLTDKRFASRDEKSAKALEKRYQLGNVTLDDVKCERLSSSRLTTGAALVLCLTHCLLLSAVVALLSLQDTEMQRVCSFTTFMR